MGFIERLRQQKEADALAITQREAELGRRREAEEAVRQQREAQERELHIQRKQRAEAYFQESGIESLISELGKIIGGSYGWVGDSPWSRRHGGGQLSSATSDWRRLPTLATDPDSVSIGIVWDELQKGTKSAPIPKGVSREHGTMEQWSEFEGKFFAVETLPDGNIIFHTRRDITVPEQKWRIDKGVVDAALEQAFNSPRTQKYNGRFSRYFPDGGG